MDFLGRIIAACCIGAVLSSVPAFAQISPGELSRAHADLEGIRNCTRCHDLGKGPSDDKCLECHREIAVRISDGRGYHKRLTGPGGKPCFECHSDHAGRDFELVHWPGGINNFEHDQTGYTLAGKHSSLKCRDCHKPDLIREDMSAYAEHVDMDRTFLGLQQRCLACHADEHRTQLPEQCADCHSQEKWKPAPDFDHAKTRYPLTGRHVKVQCAKCHPGVQDPDPVDGLKTTYIKYSSIRFDNCTRCHTDVHKGSLGADCARCHNTSGWTNIDPAGFDHSKTNYPLLGKHAGVACEKCHKPGQSRKPLPHELCVDCHADAHQQQFVRRSDGGRCESCHTVNGFSPATYTTADHNRSRFRLEGAHVAQPCFACHPVEDFGAAGSGRRFTYEDIGCESCHRDVHFGQFRRGRKPKVCSDCHGVTAWAELDFDHNRDASYKLEGEHRTVPCKGCHLTVTESGDTFIRYKPIDPSCKTCHTREGLRLNTGNTEGKS